MKTKSINIPLLFGSMVLFKSTELVFLRYEEYGPYVSCFTLDYEFVTFDKEEFDNEFVWLFQHPVKFHKGFDYCICDDGTFVNHYLGCVETFSPGITKEMLTRAENSPYHLLRQSYLNGLRTHQEYHRVTTECLLQHFKTHKFEYLEPNI